ncbi:aldo/keto reductase [Polaromonas sp. P1-6]|nr:aldo/keto reductase [Polaromonas sp. P1-6]
MRRRTLLLHLIPALSTVGAYAQNAGPSRPMSKPIPSSGEQIPVVGLGSWITFNVGNNRPAREHCAEVMRHFFDAGGRLIDSSPMYGSSQGVIGDGLQKLLAQRRVFSADKVWTSSAGAAQIEASRQLWRLPRFDLLQVHNLVAWQEQLPLLLAMKEAGQLRYVGITTSEGRRHLRDGTNHARPPHRLCATQLQPARPRSRGAAAAAGCSERGIAVLVNRPFRQGALLRQLQRHPLPAWASEIDCANWAQFALKFIVSHPAVTCAIPATGNVAHVRENMGAALGRIPDEAFRRRMVVHIEGL